jgi:hypothetical protein
MRKQAPVVDWTIAENDADWERQCALLLPDNEQAANRHRPLNRYIWGVVALLLMLVSIGGWWWHTARAGSQQAAAELHATAQQEPGVVTHHEQRTAISSTDNQSDMDWWHQARREADELLAAIKADKPGAQFDLNMRVLALQRDQAVISVRTAPIARAPAYRQTLFYRRTEEGWQQTAPDAALWGPESSLETLDFVYHFRQNDAPVVAAVLAQMDILYQLMRRNFGLSLKPDAEKLVIDVNVTQTSGYASPWFGAPHHISVPSPALYVAPVELTDAELLAQSIALPLLEQVLAQARERHAVGASWQPMLDGLHLWQVWDMDLPLSAWREEVVTWIYADLPATRPGQAVVLPEHYTALCAAHKLWMPSPMQMNIPLLCAEVAWEALLLSPWGWYDPLTHLDQLVAPLRPGEYLEEPDSLRLVRHPGHTVGLATLVEYAVVTYGRDRLPALVAGLGQYESWDTLLPAVYGASAAEFEAGWQAYLTTHYGVPLSSLFAH